MAVRQITANDALITISPFTIFSRTFLQWSVRTRPVIMKIAIKFDNWKPFTQPGIGSCRVQITAEKKKMLNSHANSWVWERTHQPTVESQLLAGNHHMTAPELRWHFSTAYTVSSSIPTSISTYSPRKHFSHSGPCNWRQIAGSFLLIASDRRLVRRIARRAQCDSIERMRSKHTKTLTNAAFVCSAPTIRMYRKH